MAQYAKGGKCIAQDVSSCVNSAGTFIVHMHAGD